jgi:preprotein translocase subunit SecY
LAFSGTSLLIAVGVVLEIVHDVEAQMKLRNYKGFLD